MAAIDIKPGMFDAWMRDLLAQLAQNRQRQLVSMQGPEHWADDCCRNLLAAPGDKLVISDRTPDAQAVPCAKAESCLGNEARLVVLDLFTGFNPDVFCIATGLVQAGGVLLLLSPTPGEWELERDAFASWQDGSRSLKPALVEYFFDAVGRADEVALCVTPQSLPGLQSTLPSLQPTVIEDGATEQQSACLRAIERWLADAPPGVALIRAGRGRGKSSCLGLLARRLAGDYRLLISARSRQAAAALLRWVPDARFVAPDRLLDERPAADLLIIDEAAMIPQSLLRQIQRLYPRLVMATTSGGYEGTGQGFMLRFVASLGGEQLLHLELEDPVRWCRGDRLERWVEQVLLLDAPAMDDALHTIDPRDCTLEVVECSSAPTALLCEVYRLLNEAHYRTRPSDLRMLMENPDLCLIVMRAGDAIVGATLLNREGGFDAALCQQVYLGNRRPKGHLLAQMLTAQAGIEGFAGLSGFRIQRIAVRASCRRQGIATRMLEAACDHARTAGMDYLGASFAIDAGVTRFWQRAGFYAAHVSFAQGKSSGSHSLVVLHPLQSQAAQDLAKLCERIERQLPTWMTQFLQLMEAGQVTALLRITGFTAELSALERSEVEAFAHANRGFELCFASLQRYVMQRVAATRDPVDPLLIEKAIQNRPWDRLPSQADAPGRKSLQRRLRALVEAELKDC